MGKAQSPSAGQRYLAALQAGIRIGAQSFSSLVSFRIPAASLEDVRGGDAGFNASVIRRVLQGERSARRDIGVLNAAAALTVSGVAPELSVGVALAENAIDEGRALVVLDELVRVSQEAKAQEVAGAST